MIFTHDSIFVIGNSHLTQGKPCQDYALSGIANGPSVFSVLSDGCSNGKRTEVGASLMAIAMKDAIRDDHRFDAIQDKRNNVIEDIQRSINICKYDLLATCLSVVLTEEGGYVLVEGDGIIAIKQRNGGTWLRKFEWEKNAPWYPIYWHDPDMFITAHGGDTKALCLTRELYYRSECHDIAQYPLYEAIHGIPVFIPKERLSDIEYIAIFSDGICQIDGMDWKDVATSLLSFKNTSGDFVKRRMNAFVKGLKQSGNKHQDDLSMSCIRIQHGDNQS